MLALFAVAVLVPLLYTPGFVIERALRGAERTNDFLERHYERAVLGALVCGWLALTLAELGVFSAWLFLLALFLVCTGGFVLAQRRSRGDTETGSQSLKRSAFGLQRFAFRNWETVAFVAIGMLFLLLVARPFEVVLGVRDAGFYANTGFAIAHHGGIVQHDEIVAQIGADQTDPALESAAAQAETNFLSNQDRTRYLNTGVRAAGFFFDREQIERGQIFPQGFHLFPAWIALLTSLLGMQGGLLATGLMGFLGLWSVGMLGRRLAGPWVGVLAMLLLALNGVQVWFSRYSTTESTAQFLTFAGMWAFVAMQPMVDGKAVPVHRPSSTIPALIAGLAFGQWALVRIEFVLVVGPVLAFLLYMWLSKRWSRSLSVLGLALGAMLVQAGLHIAFIGRGYFFDTLFARLQDKSAIVAVLTLPFLNDKLRDIYLRTPRSLINYWAENPTDRHSPLRLVLEIVLVGAVVIGLILLRRWQKPLCWFETMLQRLARPILNVSALVIVLLCAYAYVVRPQILSAEVLQSAPTCFAPAQLHQPTGACLALQGYIGAPVAPPTRLDPFAYWLDTLPKLLRQPKLRTITEAQARQQAVVRDLPTLEGRPSPGATLDQINQNEITQVLGTSSDGLSLLVRNGRSVTGWVDASTFELSTTNMPTLDNKMLSRIVNPRWATTFSPGNPSEAAKFAIYQASFVRFGWYLSPLGVILAVAGLALLWRRMNRASWLLLLVGATTTYVFLEQAYGTDEATYIYLLRRFVPLVYPMFCLGAAVALVTFACIGRKTKDGRPKTGFRSLIFRLSSFVVVITLVGFLAATNLKLYRHTEYTGALTQLQAIAAKFKPNDVLLFRGGAPSYASFRDLPDNLATPLTYAFDLNALTVKSAEPGKYATELSRYVERWQQQGRGVYLVLSASGGMALPGFAQQKVESIGLSLPEFEQLTNQKPSNVQTLTADYTVYKLVPEAVAVAQTSFAPDDYALQMRGFYRSELFEGQPFAWTNGDAMLRLPWPKDGKPLAITLKLSPGKRPATLGPTQVSLSYRTETDFDFEQQRTMAFSTPQTFTLSEGANEVSITIDPTNIPLPSTGTFLLRIESPTWIPARDAAGNNDGRALGVLYGGLQLQSR